MAAAAPNRISVLRNEHVVPLIPSVREPFGSTQPWDGLLLERHRVEAIEIPEHEHRDFCLHLQLTGNDDMEWWTEGRHGVEKTAPGSLILLPPGTRDRLRWQGSSDRLILSLEPDRLVHLAEELHPGSPAEFTCLWSLKDPSLQHLVSEMGREASEGWPLGSLYADLLGAGLSSQLLRRHVANPVPAPEMKTELPMPRLRHAMEYMTANLHKDLRLEQIARELNLSPFHFARVFRNTTGQTPYQYLLDQRMDRAKYFLKHHNLPVQEIAAMTGFSSSANFVRAFRQKVGVTPGAWRQSA